MDSSTSHHRSVRPALALLIVLLAGVGAIFLATGAPGFEIFGKKAETLGGSVSLTMTAAGVTGAYVYDFATGAIHPAEPLPDREVRRAVKSSKGDIAYICREADVFAVCVSDAETGENRVVSNNAHAFKRALEWSPDNAHVLYSARVVASTTNPYTSDGWGIFLAAADGSGERQVADGSAALFSPDGETIVYVHRDGLHQKDLANGSDALVWTLASGLADQYMTLARSPDGSRLAWSAPYAGGVGSLLLYTVSEWTPFAMTFDTSLSMRAWQMRFSPGGSWLVLSADSADGTPGLYVYDFAQKASQLLLDLSGYERQTVISDWQM